MNSEAKEEIIKMLADYEQILSDDFRTRHSYRDIFPKWDWYKSLKDDIQNVRDLRKCVNVLNGNCVPQSN